MEINSGKWAFLSRQTIGQLGKRYRIKNPRPLSKEEKRFYSKLENMTEDDYFELVEGIRKDEFPSMPEPDREKTALHNTLDEKYFFLPKVEKTALHNNRDTDLTSWPQVTTYQLPF